MKRYFQNKRLRVLAVVAVALVSVWAVGAVRDTYKVEKMTEKMKTVCVGRMLIDLPEEARVELYSGQVDGFYISAKEESEDAFKTRLAAKETELRAKPDSRGGNNNLESVREVKTASGLTGKIFVHGRYVIETTRNKGISGIEPVHLDGVALEAHVHGDGISIDVTAQDRNPDYIEDLPKLVSQLVANPENHIPNVPGFCVDQAYVRDPLKAEQGERVNMAAVLPSHPDIQIRFDTTAGIKPDSRGLLERSEAAHARAPAIVNMRFTKLRAAPRTIGSLTGDELAERVIEENFAVIYGFQWEVNGKEDDVFVPHILMVMKTGSGRDGQVMSSLAQPAALSLWDKISSSVRVRPTDSPKVSAAEPLPQPVGTVALAGEICPQSGWWACGDGGNGISVLGGQRQYLRQGQLMPQALLLPPPTVWERLRGLQPSYENNSPTAWQLVDKRSRKRIAPGVPLAQAVAAPVGTDAGAAAIEPQAAVGAYATTGKACPASGWWRSAESHALDGTRWFAQGSVLPTATFAVPPDVLGKAAVGTPKTMQRRANWMLVRLAEAPELAGGAGEVRDPTAGQVAPDSAEGNAT
jgi:hypothetical protein